MEHGLGAMAFWFFIAAAVMAGAWEKSRRNAEKHETLRRIIEKTGTVDEAKLRELFNSSGSDWRTDPDDAYRGLRIGGTIVMFVAVGVGLFFFTMWQTGVIPEKASIIGLSAAGIIAMLGIGLFYSSRFAEQPRRSRNEPPVR